MSGAELHCARYVCIVLIEMRMAVMETRLTGVVWIEFCTDYALVQTQNWTTLYVLSREREPESVLVDVSFPFCALLRASQWEVLIFVGLD